MTERASVPVLESRCWAAVTEHGTIIPWLCRTDPQQIEAELRLINRTHWTVRHVRIVLDE